MKALYKLLILALWVLVSNSVFAQLTVVDDNKYIGIMIHIGLQ